MRGCHSALEANARSACAYALCSRTPAICYTVPHSDLKRMRMAATIKLAKPRKNEYFATFTMGAILMLLVGGFIAAWLHVNSAPKIVVVTAYTQLGSMVIATQNHTIRANISIQTSKEHEEWGKKNKIVIDGIVKNYLADESTQKIIAKNNLATLQNTLKNLANTTLDTDKVEAILITDFLLVTN